MNCKEAHKAMIHCVDGFDSMPPQVKDHINNCETCHDMWNQVESVYNVKDNCESCLPDSIYISQLKERMNPSPKYININSRLPWMGVAASVTVGLFMGVLIGSHMTSYLDKRADCSGMSEYLRSRCCLCQPDHGALHNIVLEDYVWGDGSDL